MSNAAVDYFTQVCASLSSYLLTDGRFSRISMHRTFNNFSPSCFISEGDFRLATERRIRTKSYSA
jgi:hypothetical protein